MKRNGILFHGGHLRSMEGGGSEEALLVRGNRIEAIGAAPDLRSQAPKAELVDLRGSTLLPAFIDTHTHFFEWARKLSGVDLTEAKTLDEVRMKLRAYREHEAPSGAWLGGSGWDPRLLRDEERPDRWLLDEIFPEQPVALESRDFHTLWCNSAALKLAGILDGRTPPKGGEIGRGPDDSPDGLLYETAWELILKARPPEPEPLRQRWLKKAIAEAHSFGLSSFHSMEPLQAYHSYRELARAGKLGMRVVYHSPVKELEQRIAERQPSYLDADPWLRWGGVKIFADGSLGSASAYMLEPYPDGGHGRLLVEEHALSETIVRAGRSGIAPSIHAIGDGAMRVVVNALLDARASLRGEGKDLHPLARIEHAQCVRPEELQRMSSLSLSCAMQLIHLMDDLPLLDELWPTQGSYVYCARSLISHGMRVVLGSDAPVASIDPRQGISAAITRQKEENRSRGAFFKAECLSEEEALLGYTKWAAQAAAWDAEMGSLLPGKLADLVALEAPSADDPYGWKSARIRMTMVDGEIVYDDLP